MANRSRRWLSVPLVAAALVAAASAAGAQVDPPPSAPEVAVWAASCVAPGPSELVVYGRGWSSGQVALSVQEVGSGLVSPTKGSFQARIGITAPAGGSLKLTATQGDKTSEHTISVSSSCSPVVAAVPAGPGCAGAGQRVPVDINVTGATPAKFDAVLHHVDLFGPAEAVDRSQPPRALGFYSVSVEVPNVPGRTVPVTLEAHEVGGGLRYATTKVSLPPVCPPTETTSTVATAPVATTPLIGRLVQPPSGGALTNLTPAPRTPRAGGPTGPASLALSPSLGQPGQTTTVSGTGFAPSATVVLRWRPGVGEWTVRAGGDGSFRTQVLVLPNDVEGRRTLEAQGEVPASASYLVVPGSSPSAFGGVFLRG